MTSPKSLTIDTDDVRFPPQDKKPAESNTNRFSVNLSSIAPYKTPLLIASGLIASAVAGFKLYSMFSGSKAAQAPSLTQAPALTLGRKL